MKTSILSFVLFGVAFTNAIAIGNFKRGMDAAGHALDPASLLADVGDVGQTAQEADVVAFPSVDDVADADSEAEDSYLLSRSAGRCTKLLERD